MPTISLFFGIIIRMFWRDNDKHTLLHFHAYYAEYEAVFTLDGKFCPVIFPKGRLHS